MKTRFITLLIAITAIIGSAIAQTKVINIYKGDDVLYSLSVNEIDSIIFEQLIHNGHEYVDLGLSVQWATCNVGATMPEEYGDYFAWGETETKTTYYLDTYKYYNGDMYSLTKYCTDSYYGTVDNKTTLELSDDAANVNWGGDWRMPTQADYDELMDPNNCKWTWTTQNGVNGYKVTSKKNGNSIFLPAAGYRYNSTLYEAGSYGNYWSSSLSTSNSLYAYSVHFYLDYVDWSDSYLRYYGQSVRAVLPKTYTTVSVSTSDEAMGTAEVSKSNVEYGKSVTLTATPNSGYIFKNWTLNGEEVSIENPYTATITSDSEFIANFEPQPTHNGYAYIDLGLPSGIKWATCNVGATTPEEYGDYFAWGETETKTTYNWSTYKYCNGTDDSMTKYCTDSSYGVVDNKTTLELTDDAANVNWGGNWRMPTQAELYELRDTNNCTWEWTTQNGVKGYKVTSKKNGNSIFLPTTGYRDDSNLYSAGIYGYYWSSSLGTSISNSADRVYFASGDVGWGSIYRYYGQSVRAVYKTYSVSVSTSGEVMGTAEASKSNVEYGESVTLTATPNSGYIFKNWTLNGEEVSIENPYTATITSDSEFIANFEPQPTHNGYAYIDLGLSVKWATCNVGATTPEKYGDYFAWGETETKTTYDWSTYKYCNGNMYSLTKYCTNSYYGTVDNKTTLELSDDVARVIWGGNWRMPTQAEQDELRDTNNCTWEWTTQNGVNGYKVTSKKNGNYIFLPAAGYCYNSNLSGARSYGVYWSSSLDTSYSYCAYYMYLDSDYVDWNYGSRDHGLSVRAVYKTYSVSVSTSGEVMGTAEVSKSNVEYGESVTLTATPNSGYNFKNWTLNGDIISTEATYTATITSDSEFIANFEPQPTHNGYAYVDLGLSVKWATCNVGATTPEEYGNYFAWGETEAKNIYYWDTYKYCRGTYDSMTKYCTESEYGTVDNKTVLELSDDAARVNWGGDWRMPTQAEIDELMDLNNCTWTWTTQNGVNGYKVTSKRTGNFIFLPAAGCRYDINLYDTGSFGHYWSSSLDTSYNYCAYYVYFSSGNVEWSNYGSRDLGLSVRAVCE